MRIEYDQIDVEYLDNIIKELEKFRHQTPHPMPICNPNCDDINNKSCSRECEKIPSMLSSDPTMPLETAIAPLVFEMKRLVVFKPVWSCEGHENYGKIGKIPRIWFNCMSVTWLKLLGDILMQLFTKKRTMALWEVKSVSVGKEDVAALFSLEPCNYDETKTILDLQADSFYLAENIFNLFEAEVQNYRENFKAS
jgi:hypothetical protein